MLVLALETSRPDGAVALYDASPAGELTFPPGVAAPLPAGGRNVVGRAGELLRAAGARPGDLGAIAVSLGPGSYTGCRVGVTAAKTLGWAMGVPVIGRSTLEVIAAAAPSDRPVVAVVDARRGRFFAGRFLVPLGGPVERLAADRVGTSAEIASLLEDGAIVGGPGADALLAALGGGAARRSADFDQPSVEVVARVAIESLRGTGLAGTGLAGMVAEASAFDLDGLHALEPAYLQPSEPEIRRAAGRGGPRCP